MDMQNIQSNFRMWLKVLARHPKRIIGTVLIIIVAIVGLSWSYTYANSDISRGDIVVGALWYPALWISPTHIVSHKELIQNVRAIQDFYDNQDFSSIGLRVDFSTEEGRKRLKMREKELLNIFVEQEVMRDIVKDSSQRVTQREIDENVDRKLQEYGTSESVRNDLERLVGWSLDDYKKAVVEPALYREKARTVFDQRGPEPEDVLAEEKIQSAHVALENGQPFAEVAREYSEGIMAEEGGYFGKLLLGELVEPEVAKAVLSLEIGEHSAVVESDIGYHILLISGTETESAGLLYDFSQIFVRKVSFEEWLTRYKQERMVQVFIKGYEWDSESALLVFDDPEMRQFEAQSLQTDTLFEVRDVEEGAVNESEINEGE